MFKFKFEANLAHQTAAVQATLALFHKPDAPRSLPYEGEIPRLQGDSVQHLPLTWQELNNNLQASQAQQGIEETLLKADSPLRFSVEMETGTGKTYVYLKTIVELHKRHGYRKFIILVPTNAIRAGVVQSLKHLTPHFAEEAGVTITHSKFEGGNLSTIADFCFHTYDLQVLIMSTGAINRPSKNILYQKHHSSFQPDSPIDALKAVRPIVLIDEPQKASEGSNTITQLYKEINPLFMLDYSATHKESFPLLYRLDPFDAMDKHLVKRLTIRTLDTSCFGDLQLLSIGLQNQKPCATFRFKKTTKEAIFTETETLEMNASLFERSNKNTRYEALGRIKRISVTDGFVEFESGERLYHGSTLSEPVLREMMAQTIKAHFEKQKQCEPKGIKVLSLFFVDSVKDYRGYDKEGTTKKGHLAVWFEEEYTRLAEAYRQEIYIPSAERAHGGSFAQDGKGRFVDFNEAAAKEKKKLEASSYELIMNSKEELLDPDTDLRFIFAHSRLREGWDCPNIFQVCTLKQDSDHITKRQEIGRGMRLAVDKKGERLHGENPLNTLLLVTTSSYQQYLKELKQEYEEAGYNLSAFTSNDWLKYLDYPFNYSKEDKASINDLTQKRLAAENLLVESSKKGTLKWNTEGYENQDVFAEKLTEVLKPISLFVPKLDEYAVKSLACNIAKSVKGLKPVAGHVNAASHIKKTEGFLEKNEFKELWRRISQKAIYRFNFIEDGHQEAFIQHLKAAKLLEEALLNFSQTKINVKEVKLSTDDIKSGEVNAVHSRVSNLTSLTKFQVNEKTLQENWLANLASEIKLPKAYLFKLIQILHFHFKNTGSYNLYSYIVSYQEEAALKLKQAVEDAFHHLHMQGIQYQEINSFYKASELFTIPTSLVEPHSKRLKHLDKTFYIPTQLDSNIEVTEQESLDQDDAVTMYVKLPERFKVSTPRGLYNPDWAIIKKHDDNSLYLVKETKGRRQGKNTPDEELKITSAQKLFTEKEVQFEVATP